MEILAEGLGSTLSEAAKVAPPRRQASGPRDWANEPLPGALHRDVHAARRRALDEVRVEPFRPAPSVAPPRTLIPSPAPPHVSHLTKDPVMAAIFADTAATTLVNQDNNIQPGDAAAQAAARIDPVAAFPEEQVEAWNRAAFAPAKPTALPPGFVRSLLSQD